MHSIDSHIFEILKRLNVNGLNEECIDEILRTRTEAIASQKTVYQRKISDGSFELTVIPDRFAVLTFQDHLGSGTVKRVEKAIRIDPTGIVDLRAMATSCAMRAPVGATEVRFDGSRMESNNLLKEFDAASIIYSEHVVSGMEHFKISYTRKELIVQIALFIACAVAVTIGLLILTHIIVFAPHLALILGWVLFSTGAAGEIGLFFKNGYGKRQEHLLQPLYESSLEKFQKEHSRDRDILYKTTSILIGAAQGLKDIHDQGYVHNDMKKENIFVKRTADGSYTGVIGDLELLEPGTRGAAWENERFQHMAQSTLSGLGQNRILKGNGNIEDTIERLVRLRDRISIPESKVSA